MLSPESAKTEPNKKRVFNMIKWFNKMKELNKKFAILPWNGVDASRKHITKAYEILHTMDNLWLYFSRVQSKIK